MTLKHRARPQTESEQEWYEKAFGPKQNKMTIRILFAPQYTDHIRKGKSEVWVTINYKMFEELKDEFSNTKAEFPSQRLLKLEGIEDHDTGIWQFDQEFEYPYGDFDIKV